MHVGVGVFETDGGVTYAGDGVVEEWVSLLEGFEILCRNGLVHVDFCRSRIGSGSTYPMVRSAFDPASVANFVGSVHLLVVVSLGAHDIILFGRNSRTYLPFKARVKQYLIVNVRES